MKEREQKLKKLIEENKVIPFVGAGVSKAVKFKDGRDAFINWKELLESFLEDITDKKKVNIINAYLDDKDNIEYLKVADIIEENLHINTFNKRLNKSLYVDYNEIDEETYALARSIWALGSKLVITTNYDKVLDNACDDKNVGFWDINATHEQGNFARDNINNPTIWKLHGSIYNVNSIILTTEKYNQLYTDNINDSRYKEALKLLENIISSKSLLFIGFSLDDKFVVNQLKKIIDIFGGNNPEHYILLKKGYSIDTLDGNIKVIEYEDHGQPLIDKIDSLKIIEDEPNEYEEKLFLANIFDIIKSEIVVLLHQKHTHISQIVEEIYEEAKNNYNFYHFVTPTTKNRGEYYQRLGELFGISIKNSTEFVDKLSTILKNQKILLYINNFEDNTKARAKELATAIRTLRNCYTNRFNAIIIGQEKLAKMSYNTDSTLSPLNNTIKYTFPNNAKLEYNNIKALWDTLDTLAQKHIINHIDYDDIGMFDINDPLINQLFWQNIGTKRIDDDRLYWKDNHTKNIFRGLMKI